MAVSTELTELLNDLLEKPGEQIAQAIKDRAITRAVVGRYTRDRPRILYVDLADNGTDTIALGATLVAAVPQWGDVNSFISSLESPIGATKPFTPMDTDGWALDPEGVDPASVVSLIFASIPSSDVRVRYKAPHSAGTGSGVNETTVPSNDRDAVTFLAGSWICNILATGRVGARASGLRADGVGWQSMTTDFLRLSEAWKKEYNNHLHPDETEVEAAQASSNFRPESSAGTPYLLRAHQWRGRRRGL